MNFKDVKNIKIPDGVVVKITSKGVVLWLKKGVEPDIPDIPNNEIWYTSTDGNIVTTTTSSSYYEGEKPISNTYENGVGKMVFENDLTILKSFMFYECKTLKTITIPSSVTTIGNSVFNDCSSLESIIIPDSVTIIESVTFGDCTSLTSINIPNSVTSLGGWVFENCTSLTSVNIPDSITIIENQTFGGCTSLTSITIPKGVTTLYYGTFENCTSLNEISSLNPIAPTLFNSNIFDGLPEVGTLYIPQDSTGYETWLKQLPEGWQIQYITE